MQVLRLERTVKKSEVGISVKQPDDPRTRGLDIQADDFLRSRGQQTLKFSPTYPAQTDHQAYPTGQIQKNRIIPHVRNLAKALTSVKCSLNRIKEQPPNSGNAFLPFFLLWFRVFMVSLP
jgi:hypothetical protein